MGEFMLI